MQRCILKAVVFLLYFLLVGIGFCRTAAAQSVEEMQTLRLFYKEQELVVSPTRHLKPISQVAENMTVIAAKEIEAMNAHTVAEVLNRVPGLFVNFNQDFGAISLLNIQGSEQRHVLVLLDDIPWNFLSEGSAETNAIPVGIIERIEIIKGPASSAWGSSLGGVINILTKATGNTQRPTGAVRASYGERKTQDYRAQVSGLAGPVGYYLYAGRQDSDGLRSDRDFTSESLFSKFSIPLSQDIDLGLTMSASKPENRFGDIPGTDLTTLLGARSFFLAASLYASLTPELDLSLSVHRVEQRSSLKYDTLGQGNYFDASPETFQENTIDEQRTGVRGKLAWIKGSHTAILGMDAEWGTLEQTLNAGPFLQLLGLPAISVVQPTITKWAMYANDTIALDRWSITPGIRYDYNDIIGSFVSPSLGVTRRLGEKSLARASVARGFTLPPLSWTSAGGLFLSPNPSLRPESIWSYQAGMESTSIPYLWVKGTVFYHDLDDALVRVATGPTESHYVNNGAIQRRGLELEGETVPLYNLSVTTGLAYAHIKSDNDIKSRDQYTYNIGAKYDDLKAFQAQLSGHYIWWDADGDLQANYGDWVWDLNLSRKIFETGQFTAKLFLTAHNLFNGNQYTQYEFVDDRNPKRWAETGINIIF